MKWASCLFPSLRISVDYGLAEIYSICTISFKHLIVKPIVLSIQLWKLPEFSLPESGEWCVISQIGFHNKVLGTGAKRPLVSALPAPSPWSPPLHLVPRTHPVPPGPGSSLLILFAFYVSFALSFTCEYYLLVKFIFHISDRSLFHRNLELLLLFFQVFIHFNFWPQPRACGVSVPRPVPPVLQSRFLTTGPLGNPGNYYSWCKLKVPGIHWTVSSKYLSAFWSKWPGLDHK